MEQTQEIEKTESLKDIAQAEFLELLADEFLPKVKKFLPMILKKLKNSDDFMKPDEMFLMCRGQDGEIYIAKTTVDKVEINDEQPELYKLETLITDTLTKSFKK